ncbi:hypothetical protein RFI_37045 [Reticulomyxa filosa]|uniref:Uncharacterized protein n=1 Tax=Reticulomyxa filosa TaxID=46433 RepID=X6LH27_RETFI|nr:hypothetical protein RFI_37045 [Reticulomyxa filosa]|eukprot:ETO00402.1 hypothetical protein RFI_37045 [Reticulomyxa filosa]
MTATKKELDTNNNEDWKYMKPRPALNEWDELSEYDDIYVFQIKKKKSKSSAATTENEKFQPWQINENRLCHFPNNILFYPLRLQIQTDTHLWMTRVSPKKKNNYYFVTCTKYQIILYFFLVGGKTTDKVQFDKP